MPQFDRWLPALPQSSELAVCFARIFRTLESMALEGLRPTGRTSRDDRNQVLKGLWARTTDAEALPHVQTEPRFLTWAAVQMARIVREAFPGAGGMTPQLARILSPRASAIAAHPSTAIDRVERLVLALPVPQQMVAALHFFGARSVAEISQLIAMQEKDVRTHLHEANITLRKELGEGRTR